MGRGGTYLADMRTPYDDAKQLGTAAKKARLNAGLTQDQLAEQIGTTRKRIGNIERGDETTLGATPEEWFATVAPIAAATGDLSLIGLTDPQGEAEILSLRRDVARLDRQVHRVAGILVEAHLLPEPELPQLLEEVAASDRPPTQRHGADEGRSRV